MASNTGIEIEVDYTLQEEMECYDDLPPKLREVVDQSPLNISPVDILNLWYSDEYDTEEELIKLIRQDTLYWLNYNMPSYWPRADYSAFRIVRRDPSRKRQRLRN